MAHRSSDWISRITRLAIYARDGMCCVWCGKGVEDGIILSLDHIIPQCQDGPDTPDNLVTACRTCNQIRGCRNITKFAKSVASYRGDIKYTDLVCYIRKQVSLSLPMDRAKVLLDCRFGKKI